VIDHGWLAADKGKAILVRLCERLEADRPADLAALYVLTHAATHEFNALEAEFEEAGSEIETVRPTPRPALPRRHVSITGVSSAT
jgi:hypothetical protein